MKGGGLASKFHVKRKSFLFWPKLFVWNLAKVYLATACPDFWDANENRSRLGIWFDQKGPD